MAISLSDGIAVSTLTLCAFAISDNDPTVSFMVMLFQPAQQRGTKVETDVRVIVDRRMIAVGRVFEEDGRIRLITFSMNALVPIMKRRRAGLSLYDPGPGIFTRRLVKVAVNDQKGHVIWEAVATCRD